MTEEHRHFGAMVRQARRRAGMTQTELATAIGSLPLYIARLERGEENPPLLTCCALAKACGARLTFYIEPAGPVEIINMELAAMPVQGRA